MRRFRTDVAASAAPFDFANDKQAAAGLVVLGEGVARKAGTTPPTTPGASFVLLALALSEAGLLAAPAPEAGPTDASPENDGTTATPGPSNTVADRRERAEKNLRRWPR